jgi:SAM-dependent MidA family methyltransferase
MTALRDEIVGIIRAEGPISIARYMELALGHPKHGYYITRDPFGAAGDFITAPEVSQMFGELIGLWIGQVWLDQGAPAPVTLAEAGPGRGTLMADAWRALAAVPGFHQAACIHLIETSPTLRRAQAERLSCVAVPPSWHDDAGDLPSDRPLFLIANEFLDALPIRQFERRDGGWRERLVGLRDGGLAFGLAPAPEPALRREAPEGAVLEVAPAGLAFTAAAASRLVRQGGAALFLDYGHSAPGFGDTLQAMRSHAFADPLESPGAADLTAHVDFAAVAAAARGAEAMAHGPVAQGDLLQALGIDARAQRLAVGKDAVRAAEIASARDRLTDMSPTGMGALFKALAILPPGAPSPPGFP